MKSVKPITSFNMLRGLERMAVRRAIFHEAKTHPHLLDDLEQTLDNVARDDDFVAAAVSKYLQRRERIVERSIGRHRE